MAKGKAKTSQKTASKLDAKSQPSEKPGDEEIEDKPQPAASAEENLKKVGKSREALETVPSKLEQKEEKAESDTNQTDEKEKKEKEDKGRKEKGEVAASELKSKKGGKGKKEKKEVAISEPILGEEEKGEEGDGSKKEKKTVSISQLSLDQVKKDKKGGKGKKGKKEISGSEPSLEKVKKEKKGKKPETEEDEAAEGDDKRVVPAQSVENLETSPSGVSARKLRKKKSKTSESLLDVLKRKKESAMSLGEDGEPVKKMSGIVPSGQSIGETTKKKKKRKKSDAGVESSAISLEPSDADVDKKRSKGKKLAKSASIIDDEGGAKKKTKKQKKTPPSSQPSLGDVEKTGRKRGAKRGSRPSITLGQAQPSYQQFLKSSEMQLGRMKKVSSIWTISESGSDESGSSEESGETPRETSIVALKQKGKKGKKGKKEKEKEKKKQQEEERKKREEEEALKRKQEEEERARAENDVMAQIARMKQLAAAPKEPSIAGSRYSASRKSAPGALEAEKPPKKKKGPKKKLSKKEKARLAAEQAEKARISAEEEAAQAAELERIRLEEEKRAAIEKEKRETIEQKIRLENLDKSVKIFKDLVAYNKKLRADAKTKSEWEVYVNCGRLPNPSKCDQMNTFLHLWENMVEETSMEQAAAVTKDVLEMLNELDDLIDTAETANSVVDNWKWVRLLFRQQQSKSLDVASYRLLRNIDKNLNRIDIPTADYQYEDDNIALSLWLRIQLPTPLPNPRRPPKPRIEVQFPQMKLEVQFPLSIDGEKIAVRALYVKYDHLSDLCEFYDKPPVPEPYNLDLYQAMKLEWREKLLYKYYNRVRKPPPAQEGEEPPELPPDELLGPDEEVPIVPYRKLEPTASQYVMACEDELYHTTRINLAKNVSEDVINLRKYSIIGGIYSLNLISQPPQPQDFVTLELNLTPLYLPKELEYVDLDLEYNPPVPAEPGVRRAPEEIEEDMKRQEEELEKLILVTLTWPDHVIFLELPMVCYWNDEKRVWSKSEVHDLKHNEEKGQLTFRTRKAGTFALAVYRYANLPYQAWEMRPEVNGSVSLQITAAILMVEFNVKDGQIALSQLQNSPNNALQDIVGIYYPLPKLIRMLQSAGVDVFPAFDAFCYIENTCEKHWPMEKQLYFNMAQMAVCFNFAWSRWNMTAGRRGVVLQMREYNLEKTKQKNHLMLHVTPLSAIYVDCTEVSQTFNEEGIENMKFYADLIRLMKGTSPMAVKNKVTNASKQLVFALYELLTATRVVSFS